mmetsp:Transcript_27344/g.36900  ORF Transcript_27344/g.36900 Transcript_27344/m.36900 type:complete len:299 (+) Transcript_27344:3-899(+)
MAMRANSKRRAPLKISFPGGAEPADVWAAMKWKVGGWSDKRLRDAAKDDWVYASCLEEGGPQLFGLASQRRVMRFSKFLYLSRSETGARCFLNVQGMKGELYQPPLQGRLGNDVPIPEWLPLEGRQLDTVTLWMGRSGVGAAEDAQGQCRSRWDADGQEEPCPCGGTAGSLSRLHHDNQDNVIAVADGEKHYALFPPSQAPNLYTVGGIRQVLPSGVVRYDSDMPGQGDAHGTHFSLVADAFSPSAGDLERFPLLRNAMLEGGQISLSRGELLFLPAGWFHQVRSCSRHVAVNFWWNV